MQKDYDNMDNAIVFIEFMNIFALEKNESSLNSYLLLRKERESEKVCCNIRGCNEKLEMKRIPYPRRTRDFCFY